MTTINKKYLSHLLVFISSICFISCDPIHDLKIQNGTGSDIEIIYYPQFASNYIPEKHPNEIENLGLKMYSVNLAPDQLMPFGTVVARYNPRPDDIEIEYLEIRMSKDTMIFKGKGAIFSALQKIDKLDWRIVAKAH